MGRRRTDRSTRRPHRTSPGATLPHALLIPTAVRYSSHAAEESYEAFNARYASFFGSVTDLFELQRGLNNAFAYDLVPSVEVIENALRAARKVNDYATAVRILEGVKAKVENKGQYEQYLAALKPIIDELGKCSSQRRRPASGANPRRHPDQGAALQPLRGSTRWKCHSRGRNNDPAQRGG